MHKNSKNNFKRISSSPKGLANVSIYWNLESKWSQITHSVAVPSTLNGFDQNADRKSTNKSYGRINGSIKHQTAWFHGSKRGVPSVIRVQKFCMEARANWFKFNFRFVCEYVFSVFICDHMQIHGIELCTMYIVQNLCRLSDYSDINIASSVALLWPRHDSFPCSKFHPPVEFQFHFSDANINFFFFFLGLIDRSTTKIGHFGEPSIFIYTHDSIFHWGRHGILFVYVLTQ